MELRAGTENTAGIAGMAKAFELAAGQRSVRMEHIKALKKEFLAQLESAFPGLRVNGPPAGRGLHSILNVSFPEHEIGDMLQFSLDLNGVAVSSGSACASGANEVSHVLKAIGKADGRPSIRFSFSHLNTTEELSRTIKILQEIMD